MSVRISQPVGKVLMTNVATVRIKRDGKRFEIACYKNKVQNWRNGVEEDINEVLQIAKVYENVSKGKFAKFKDWTKVFGVKDEEEACRLILEQGELQVSEGERKAQVEKCVLQWWDLVGIWRELMWEWCIGAACTRISRRSLRTSA
jgi:ribosome maturation protein SDO1